MTIGSLHNVALHDRKFAFMVLKKCASQSFYRVILQSLGYSVDISNIAKVFGKPSYLLPGKLPIRLNKYEINALGYDTVTWVKNPFDRLVSGWVHRVSHSSKPLDTLKEYGMPSTTSFEDYINHICSFRDEDLNVHFRQQTFDVAINDRLIPNIVVKLENLQEEWEEVRKRFEWLCPVAWHENKTKEIGQYKQYYTEEMIEKVNSRFAKDLEILGYEF